jgi:hypothetical protein
MEIIPLCPPSLVTLLRRLRLPKIDFGTFQLGIAQLVPRVSGSPSPPSPLPAPKNHKKKKFQKKKVPNPPPHLPPPIDWKSTGAIGKNIPEWLKRPLEFRRATKPVGDLELSPGRWSSNQTRTVHQRSTNQIRPHCTATYLDQLSLHLPHKVAPALFSPRLLCLALSNRPILPRGQHDFQPEPTTPCTP